MIAFLAVFCQPAFRFDADIKWYTTQKNDSQ
jgi:hypothetical protein